MAHPVPSALRFIAPRLAPCGGDALLRLLDAPEPDWHALGELALRDVTLCLPLLAARPLEDDEAAEPSAALAARLELAGAAVLRAWLFEAARPDPTHAGSPPELARAALVCAECAHHLAVESHYPRPREAYLAGMWLVLGRALSAGTSRSANDCAAALAHSCGLPLPVLDALLIERTLEETVVAAHPLARILWSADRLAGDPACATEPPLAAMTGLPAETLLSLRTDVGFIAAQDTGGAPSPTPWPTAAELPASLRTAALDGLLGSAFATLDEDRSAARLGFACRLLHGIDAPLVLVAGDDGKLSAQLTANARLRTWIAELALDRDDDTSMIARALRSHTPATQSFGDGFGGRSPRDWQIARWLGANEITALPLGVRGAAAVAVFPLPQDRLPRAAQDSTLRILLAQASAHLLRQQAERQADAARSDALRARYLQHARTLVHEANNPLTVIRSYVGLLEQRNQDNASLRGDLQIIGNELGRIGELLGRLATPPEGEEAEVRSCDVGRLLDEVQALCATPLFARHGIRFDLRKTDAIPQAAMPASELRQVLLNLLRNASEALSPGGRCALTVPGQLVVDGRRCVEIRLIDNGPGLPAERLTDMFGTGASTKGGAHQGMGLAIVRDILSRWQASIVCRSQAGAGTSFQLFIPVEAGR